MTGPWRWTRRGLGLAVLASAAALVATSPRNDQPPGSAYAAPLAPLIVRMPRTATVAESLHDRLVALAPFRPNRIPTDPPITAQPSTPPVRPSLVLSAIVWGERPAAVIEGLPGVEGGRVVVAGDTVGGLAIRAIGRLTAVVAGPDTTWLLRLEGSGS